MVVLVTSNVKLMETGKAKVCQKDQAGQALC